MIKIFHLAPSANIIIETIMQHFATKEDLYIFFIIYTYLICTYLLVLNLPKKYIFLLNCNLFYNILYLFYNYFLLRDLCRL